MTDPAPSRRLHLGAFALFLLAYQLIAALAGKTRPGVVMLSLAYLVIPLGASLAAFRAARRAAPGDRTPRMLLAAALALMSLGEAWWAAWQIFVDPAGPPGPDPSDAAFLAGYFCLLFFIARILWNRFGSLTILGRLGITIDGIQMTTIAILMVTMIILPNLLKEGGGPESFVYSSYVLLDLVILIGLLLAALIGDRGRWEGWMARAAGGMALIATADLVFNYLIAAGTYTVGIPVSALLDGAWMTGYYLLGTAAISYGEANDRPLSAFRRISRPRGIEAAPLLTGVLAIPVLMWQGRHEAAGEASYWIWVTAATWIGMLVVSRVAVIAADNRELASRSITDPLTGVTNHRFFQERLGIEVDRARRNDEPLSLALLDLDDLRTVNNTRGHLAGDRRIREVASAIAETVRATDTVSRVGGDEFAVILPGTKTIDAYAVIDRVVDEIAARQATQAVRTTVSVGMVSFPEHAADRDELADKAGEALQAAKDAGRNRVVVYEPGTGGRTTEERIRAVEAESLLRTVRSLAAAVDARDAYTHSHSRSVTKLAVALARRLGFTAGHVDQLKIAALLHDVGKIGTPDHVLRKPGELNDEEYRIVMGHPELGERILASAVSPEVLPWVLCHHERWDGSGYPGGISGEAIPIEARIIAVCDTFDAMTSDRPYRLALPVERAVAEIEAFSGRQFDPAIATAFVTMIREADPV
jgi:diguanylate cyclase (GGDEF)-like protein/putative nucleotidyltransferase with HDIG domain